MLSKTLQSRYFATTFDELASRVSRTVAKTPTDQDKYYELISSKRFIPAGNNLLAGIDNVRPNCAILPSVSESNFDEIAARSQILWSDRTGIGFDLSEAEDPISILWKLSELNAAIKFDHRPQRGNMAVLKVSHPKIKDFITLKSSDTGKSLYNFNISVAFENNEEFSLSETNGILDLISKNTYLTGDPGIVFLDKLQGPLTTQKCVTVVPCGEQAMYEELCTLGSMNLNCDDFWSWDCLINNYKLNVDVYKTAIMNAVKFLDGTLDIMQTNDAKIAENSLYMRRIGLGVMGFADVLHRLNVKYGSKESLDVVDMLGSLYKEISHKTSIELGLEKGFCKALLDEQKVSDSQLLRRNIMVTCIAPTGGINLLTSNKGFGIEPYFSEANNLTPEAHMLVQNQWQKYVDNCISKTINLKNSATVEDIKKIWQYARQNLKSITIYRDGCRENQPISTSDCPSGKCDL